MGWSELLIVVVVAIVLIGPHDLLPMLKVIVQQIYSLKRMVYDAQTQFEDMLRDVEFDDVRPSTDDTLDVELAPAMSQADIRMETDSDEEKVAAVTVSPSLIEAKEKRLISSSSQEDLLFDLEPEQGPHHE